MALWRPKIPSRTNTKNRCPFHYRGLECKRRKSRHIWRNRQVWPYRTNEAGQRLTEFCQENALIIIYILFQQHRRYLYTWTSPEVNIEIRLIVFFAAEDGETLNSHEEQDWKLTVAQIMNSSLQNSDLIWRKYGKALGSITTNKSSGGNGIPAKLFKILNGDAIEMLHSICQQIWKNSAVASGLQNVSFHSNPQRRAILRNVQTTAQLCSFHMLAR